MRRLKYAIRLRRKYGLTWLQAWKQAPLNIRIDASVKAAPPCKCENCKCKNG